MKKIPEGIFQVLNQKKEELIQQQKEVYNLSVGTPDFEPAKHIIEAVTKAAAIPENYKYSLADLRELVEAVIWRYEHRYGVILKEEEIMSVYGSQEGIAHIGLSLLDPGDVVLVPNPGYPIFNIGPAIASGELIRYDLREENNYLPILEDIPQDICERAKFMIVSYPLNPVGKAAPRQWYKELISWAKKYHIIIIHDNAYSDIIFDGRVGGSILALEGAKEIAVEFYSLSKSYNFTGARVGFLVGNEQIVQNFRKLRSQIDYGTFLPVQYGAIAALRGSDAMILEQCKEYEKRRNTLCDGFRSFGWNIENSEGTMFVWSKIPKQYGEDDVAFVLDLMEETGVIVTPGSSFGSLGKGYVRLALILPCDVLEKVVSIIGSCSIFQSN